MAEDKKEQEAGKTSSVTQDPKVELPFLIVGIGASAGGLDAFQKFFSSLPQAPDMAFVLIQHLDPNHESMMPELLSRHTGLQVLQVTEQTPIEKNTVYIIPPGKYLGLEGKHLVLSPPPESRGMRMAIDFFFKTLAENLREKAVCIVLSGTGSDGTTGLREVKANGGLAIVQDPETAQHDGMPRSAISTGAVDRILAPEEMPKVLQEYARHPYVNGINKGALADTSENDDQLEDILALLYTKTGHEFKHYKKSTLARRIQRRMSLNHIGKARDYLVYLKKSDQEAEDLFKDILINVTAFFREPEAWETLEKKVIPKLIERCDKNSPIRVWAPGCASGEEVYSIAMLLHEAIERREKRCDVQIFGTDIDKDAFQIARNGRYPESIAAQVSSERLERFFDREDGFFVVKKYLRESVVFAPQSLINDPPFSKQDLVICRNLLIYLEADTQFKVIRLFHFALKEDGFLFLGNSETIGSQKDLFTPVSKNWRIFKRLGAGRQPRIELPVFRTSRMPLKRDDGTNNRRPPIKSPVGIIHEALVNVYAPPAVLVDRNFDILFYQGETTKYLKLPEGEPTRNLLDHLAPGMRTKTRWLLQNVIETDEPNTFNHVLILSPEQGQEKIRLEATPLKRPPEAKGLILVTFFSSPKENKPETEADRPGPDREGSEEAAIQQLEYELQVTREELQSTIEEMETSNEELKASNEEVMSMNEELQSTNEELETSKEELQSLNEELTTVNNELREKVKELEEANDDMANLLASTHIPTIFLDRHMCIKRFTPGALDVMHLVGSDTGRRIDHIVKRFNDDDLGRDLRKVHKELIPIEREVCVTESEKYYIRRILPYRTQDERIAGVVVTFIDITQRRRDMMEIKEREDQLRKAIRHAPLPVMLLAEDDEILMISGAWARITGYTEEELKTHVKWTEKAYGAKQVEVLSHIQKVLAKQVEVDAGEFVVLTKSGKERIWHFHFSLLGRLSDGRRMIIAMAIDTTTRRAHERRLKEKEAQLQEINVDLEEKISKRTRNLEEKTLLLEKMTMELSQVEQRERRSLASRLHDDLQQIIAAARFRLETYSRQHGEEDNEILAKVQALLMDAIKACRNITSNLAPSVLYDSGLFKALNWVCHNFKDRHGLEVACHIPEFAEDNFNRDKSIFIFQSVKELLFNIVKHAETGHASLTCNQDDNGCLHIRIQDKGVGFDPEKIRENMSRSEGGYGLFSIQQRIAYIGGKVKIISEPGHGTCVDIYLPRQVGTETECNEQFPKEKICPDKALRQVMIVDDHPIFREGLKSLLENEKDIVIIGEASSGKEAIEKVQELNPDVVLMDVNMPEMNGIQATQKILKEQPDVRVIGLSINAEEESSEAMFAAGAHAYLPKGGLASELIEQIRKK